MEELGSHWMDFQEIWYWRIFRKSKKNTSFVKIWQLTECKLHEDRYTSLIIYRPFFRIMRFLGRENQNAYFMFSNLFFFRNLCLLWDNVEKYSGVGQATNDNIPLAHCMLDTWGYKYTLRICNTCCFSTAALVVRTHLSATLYVRFLSLDSW